MPRDYDEHFECFDDTVCGECHKKLRADAETYEPEYFGFCSGECMNTCIERMHGQINALTEKIYRMRTGEPF